MPWTNEKNEKLYQSGQIDVSEYRARLKGIRKNWSEEKILRRANMRRYSKKIGLGLLGIITGGLLSKK